LYANSSINRCPVCGTPIFPEKIDFNTVCIDYGNRKYCFCSETCKNSFLEDPRIAYFSMEIAIANDIQLIVGDWVF